MGETSYWSPPGFDPSAPAQGRAAQWDDATQVYTAWDPAGNVTESRPYTSAESAAAAAQASAIAAQAAVAQARASVATFKSALPTFQAQVASDVALWQAITDPSQMTPQHVASLLRNYEVGWTTLLRVLDDLTTALSGLVT